jgi:8-oxo-dGTP pyrophosphatase MutT (NUDIX family)
MDESDADVIAAAIREAHEEIALDPNMVDIIGTTDPYLTITGFRVTPVIAVIPPDLPLHPNEGEVAAIFETPLSFLLNPANHLTNTLDWQGGKRTYHEMFWNDRRIWGATAAMIVNLSQRLAWT